jgi:putative ABC transport system ATP-binding protein
VAIARAIVNNPPILLADEPTGNLDTKTAKEVMTILKQLNKNGQTILMVTHNLSLCEYSSRMIKVRDGECVLH